MTAHELTDPTGSALTITHNADGVWVTATEDPLEVTVGPFPAGVLHDALDEATPPDTLGDIAGRVRRLLAGAVNELEGDLMDGGVTAAAVEAEVVSPERARSLVQERDEAKAFATLWKRTAREQVRRTRNIAGRTRVQADYIGRLRREVEKARQQGDVDPLPIIDEVARQDGVIHELRKQLEDVERAATASPRPLTADDITDEMVERGAEAIRALVADSIAVHGSHIARTRTSAKILMAALTPPPTRPEGAEEIEALVDEWKLLPECPATPRPTLPDFLAERGVRVTGAES